MRKGWLLISLIVVGAVAVPAVVLHTEGGGWLRGKMMELHGQGGGVHGGAAPAGTAHALATAGDVALPFELATGHIIIQASVNDSPPLSFILDTGDKYGIIDLDRAKALNLAQGGSIAVRGVGPQTTSGAYIKDATFRIAGLPGFSQPVAFAMPLANIAARLGHAVDGIIGADFISEFVVELDYEARTVKLHDKRTFDYRGSGEILPMRLDAQGHPLVRASVTPLGGEPIQGEFTLDIGSGGTLALHSPFVSAHHLPGSGLKTVRAIGHGGTGGAAAGKVGRVAALTVGRVTLRDVTTMFSEDRAGAFAANDSQGNIGQKIIGRFRVWLDYGRQRIILEPTEAIADPFGVASSGLRIEAAGPDYRTFRVTDLLEASPASDAGLKVNDVIMAIDGRAASDLTLTGIEEMFERPVARGMTIQRGAETVSATLTPRRLH